LEAYASLWKNTCQSYGASPAILDLIRDQTNRVRPSSCQPTMVNTLSLSLSQTKHRRSTCPQIRLWVELRPFDRK